MPPKLEEINKNAESLEALFLPCRRFNFYLYIVVCFQGRMRTLNYVKYIEKGKYLSGGVEIWSIFV